MVTRLKNIIAPSFWSVHSAIKRYKYTHYWLKGGRGSTKSSFIAIEIVLGMMKDPLSNTVVLRKVKDTLKDSVREQLIWAIDILGVSDSWHIPGSNLVLTYKPTGQQIKFRGADKPKKIKSIKFSKGYCKYLWYEEVDEFSGIEEIRMINQSLMRGGEDFQVFYSFNPPKSVNNWVNAEVEIPRDDRLVHHSTYLEVDPAWLGKIFIVEAEHLKETKESAYNHEYLGEVTGTGGEVFENIKLRVITDGEIENFFNERRGIDFGYAVDPFAYNTMHYDTKKKRLYIFFEISKVKMSNKKAIEEIKVENVLNKMITADSAEPKSIAEFNSAGLRVKKAKKGPDSVDYGIKFLQDLEEIIIDPIRCPQTAEEFLKYEIEKDARGEFKAEYPDKNNHHIDATRYAMEDDMKARNWGFSGKKKKTA